MPSPRLRLALLLPLAIVLIATRAGHIEALPDASWAVFFLAGYYLRGWLALGFPLLFAAAVLTDAWVIESQGLSFFEHYCVSPAYWFLLPAYASLSAGGAWLASAGGADPLRALVRLPLALVASVAVCFLLSNGSFYWLSGTVAEPTLGGWLLNMSHWFLPFLATTALWTGIAVLLHGLTLALLGALLPARRLPPRA